MMGLKTDKEKIKELAIQTIDAVGDENDSKKNTVETHLHIAHAKLGEIEYDLVTYQNHINSLTEAKETILQEIWTIKKSIEEWGKTI